MALTKQFPRSPLVEPSPTSILQLALRCVGTITGLALLLTVVAQAQTSQFHFDANGNLQVQSPELIAPPQIISRPQNQIVAVGDNASFLVVATGAEPLTYQWRFNGADIGGATSDVLLLQNVGATNEGDFRVVVSNASGSVTSAPAFLWLDTDRDGMSDTWEFIYFGNLNRSASGDFDGDGNNNLREFQDGTDPTNINSALFKLFVVSDAGTVSKAPDQGSYTPGQMVTVTAVPPTNGGFHAWLGDVITRTNPLTLVMTNDKTLYARFTPIVFTWTNTIAGNWNVASNWTPNLVPGSNDTAIITSPVTVTLDTPAHCADVTLGNGASNPTLTGSGNLTVRGKLTWSSGTISGSGRIIIESGGTLEINAPSSAPVSLVTRTLENGGAAFWTGNGNLALNSGAVLTNRAGAFFDIQNAASLGSVVGGGRIDNAGTFRKSGSAGTTTVESFISFNNSGTVEIQTGTLSLGGGGVHSGSFDVSGGAALILAGGTHTASASSSLTGAGQLSVSGGTANFAGLVNVSGSHTFSGGTANFTGNTICTNNTISFSNGGTANFSGIGLVSPAVVNLSNGTLGGSSTVTVNTAMNWSQGSINDAGRLMIAPGATLNISNPIGFGAFLNTRTLENGGTILWTGTGNVVINSGGVITNRPGALFHAQNAASIVANVVGGRIDNAGTFRKSANSGTTTVDSFIGFNNSGTVDIQTGTLSLGGGGAHSGSFDVPGGAALRFAGGTHTANASSSITGAGQFFVSGGTANLAGLVNVRGNYTFSGGTANFTGNTICTNNTISFSNGSTANFSGTGLVSPAVVNLSNGTLGGSSSVTVNAAMNWSQGSINDAGRLMIAPGATLNISNPIGFGAVLNTRTLENAGTVLWTGSGNIVLSSSAVITNRPGALFHAQNAASIVVNAVGGRIDNAGTFRKSANSGTTTIDSFISFNNSGTVEIQTGTLNFVGGGTATASSSMTGAGHLMFSGGTYNLASLVNVSGSNIFSGGTANFTGNAICTNNTITISGGTANFSGSGLVSPAIINLSNGTLDGSAPVSVNNAMSWTGGTMSGSGRTIIAPGATLNIANAAGVGALLNTRTLENGGTVLWTGAGSIALNLGAVVTNRAGALFHALNASTIQANTGVGRFDNAGTFRKSASVGTVTVQNGVSFNNSGTVDIRNGILAANSGYVSSANALLNCVIGGLTPGVGYGRLQVAGAVALAGSLSVALTNNIIPPANSLYTVLSAGSRSGSFANFSFPGNADMVMSNTPNSVVVRALGPYFATTTLPDAMRNVGYTQQVTAVMNSGPIVYSVAAGALPDGLSFSSGGLISGIPAVFGNSLFTIQASNTAGVTIQQEFNLRVRNQMPEGLISWWRAENNVLDSISTNHGVLTNGATFAVGTVGQTFALDGVNDYVHVPDSPSLRPASITLEAWAMFNSQNGPVFCKPLGPASGDSFALYLLGGTLNGFIHDTNAAGVLVSSPSTLSLGQWHHVAFTFDDSTKEQALYVNGVRVATSQSNRSIGYDNKPVLLGQDINNGAFDFPLNGRIDEASIYNRALSSNEIAGIHLAGSSGKPLNAPYFATPVRLPDAVLSVGYTQQVSAVLGTGPITFSTPSGGLPSGLNLSSTGTISGIPLVAGTHSFILRATDSLGAFSDQQTTLRVVAPVAAPDGLISWWRGEGNALDSAGTNHGTASNGVVYVEGKVGRAFAFDGINDFVHVPDAPNLRPTSITLEAWAKFNGTQGPVFGRSWGSGIHNSYVIWQLSGNINGTIGDTNQAADILSTPFAPLAGQWYHVAFTFDDATKQQALYLNGALVASGQSFRSVGYDNHPVVIGGDIDNGTVSFLLNGGVDEAAIYNRALTAGEIAAIHDAGIAGKQLQLLTPYQQWKQTYLGDANAPDSADPDGDGFNNLAEYTADTNPTNAASHLRITGVSFVPGGIAFQWQGGTQATQYLQCTFDLSAAAPWTDVFTNLPPTVTPSGFTNASATNVTQFYRLRALR